jgi:hypothetical protein
MQKRNYATVGIAIFCALTLGWLVATLLRGPRRFVLAQAAERLGMATGLGDAVAAASPRMPELCTMTGNRHLIEYENGKPFFMAGIAPQNIIYWCTPELMDAYFADRQREHFNFAWVMIDGYGPRGMQVQTGLTNPTDARGHSMLLHGTSWDPKNLNPAYVASVDAMVRAATQHRFYLFLDPFDSAYQTGRLDFDPTKYPLSEMRRWGEFWGKRYRDFTNVNFALGNDRLVWPQVDSVVSGLEQYMPDRLVTIDWISGPPDWSSAHTSPHDFYEMGHHWINFNGWYEYHAPQWATWYHYHMVDPVMPTAIFETMYEDLKVGNPWNRVTGPQTIREEVWGTVLNGGSGFGILGAADCCGDPMRWVGKTKGVNQAEYCTNFFTARRWYELIPDWSHTFLTSQAGTPGENDFTYVSAALTRDGSLGVCYNPGESGRGCRLTINMSKMGGGVGESLARWYDPTNGTYKTIGTLSNSGYHTFITPPANSAGAADWVLVLEGNNVSSAPSVD